MLTKDKTMVEQTPTVPMPILHGDTRLAGIETNSTLDAKASRLERALSLEWMGQTVASACWIVSVFTYGISSAGDWLQLAAASAWLVANFAALANVKSA